MKSLGELVDEFFLSELKDWGLVRHEVEQQSELLHSSVLVVGPRVVLQIVADHEGAAVSCFCEGPDGLRSYALGLFLIVRRVGGYDPAYDFSAPNLTDEQSIAAHLKGHARRLADHGRDILDGKTDWIAKYGHPPGIVHGEGAELIRTAAGGSLGSCDAR